MGCPKKKVATKSLTTLLVTLRKIDRETSDVRQTQKQEEQDQNVDKFTALKNRLAKDIREIRQQIKERDDLNDSKGDEALIAKRSAQIRSKLAEVAGEAEELEKMQQRREKKLSTKKKLSEEKQNLLQDQKNVVELAWKHIKDCENLEKFRGGEKATYYDSDEEDSLYQNDERVAPVVALPDIDDPKFQILIIRDKQIDEGLKVIEEGVDRLKVIAEDMHGELEEQDIIIDELNDKTDIALEHLQNVNKQLVQILEKVRGGRNFCCDVIMFLVLIGVGVAIYVIVK